MPAPGPCGHWSVYPERGENHVSPTGLWTEECPREARERGSGCPEGWGVGSRTDRTALRASSGRDAGPGRAGRLLRLCGVSAPRPDGTAGVWQDPDPVDAGWSAPPQDDPARAPQIPADEPADPGVQGRRRLWLGLGAVAAVILLVALVAGFGGFTQRQDLATTVPPGATITTGPYELSFSAATVQRTELLGDPKWEIVVLGRGRTTGSESVTPNVGFRNPMFAARANNQVVEPKSLRFGAERRISDGGHFTPGLPATDFVVQFELDPPYEPPTTLVFAVWSQEFRDTSLLRNQDPDWTNGKQFWRYELPMTRLPDKT